MILSEEFTQISKEFNDDKTVLIFTNEKQTETLKDLKVNIIWQIKDGIKPAVVQNCSNFESKINISIAGNLYDSKISGCGFELKKVKDILFTDAIQMINSADFRQIDMQKEESDNLVTITFTNEKPYHQM